MNRNSGKPSNQHDNHQNRGAVENGSYHASFPECERYTGRLRQLCECRNVPTDLCAGFRRKQQLTEREFRPTPESLLAMAKRGKTRRFILNGRITWRRPSEGLGDTIEHFLWNTGFAQRFTPLMKKVWGSCGCDFRRKWLNWYLPYSRLVWARRLSVLAL